MKKENLKKILMGSSTLAILGATIIGGGVLAKYLTKINGTDASLDVAKWNITAEGGALARKSYDEKTVKIDKMAPGTEGTFSVEVNPNDTETGIDYTVTIDKLENKPSNLYFIVDGDESNKIYRSEDLGTALSGHIDVGGSKAVHNVKWKWDYTTQTSPDGSRTTVEENDAQDTLDGQAAKTMTINYTITATQSAPIEK